MNTTIVSLIEMAGTMAFAISGIRLAAAKRFDLFGAYVVGLITAIGGGTIRDTMLGLRPFWMEQGIYITITAVSLLMVIFFSRQLLHFKNTFFIFDTIGLALFTVVGLDKTLDVGLPLWVAVVMGMITGCFGGVLRDMMVGDMPLLFRRDIYALASLLGGGLYSVLLVCGMREATVTLISVVGIVIMRLVAVKFHLHLPTLSKSGEKETEHISLHSQKDDDV